MNSTKRNLILWSSIINLVYVVASFVLSILILVDIPAVVKFVQSYYIYGFSISTNIAVIIFSFALGLVRSILLFYSIRKKGKYFRKSQGCFVASLILFVFSGTWLCWILLFISMFVPDIVVMNTPKEVRTEEKKEQQAFEDKKKEIEQLKKLRADGIISDEEYRQRIIDIL